MPLPYLWLCKNLMMIKYLAHTGIFLSYPEFLSVRENCLKVIINIGFCHVVLGKTTQQEKENLL